MCVLFHLESNLNGSSNSIFILCVFDYVLLAYVDNPGQWVTRSAHFFRNSTHSISASHTFHDTSHFTSSAFKLNEAANHFDVFKKNICHFFYYEFNYPHIPCCIFQSIIHFDLPNDNKTDSINIIYNNNRSLHQLEKSNSLPNQ